MGAAGRIVLGFSRASGKLYEEVSKTWQFGYQTIERLIDENVSSGLLPFKRWIKGVLHMMAKICSERKRAAFCIQGNAVQVKSPIAGQKTLCNGGIF